MSASALRSSARSVRVSSSSSGWPSSTIWPERKWTFATVPESSLRRVTYWRATTVPAALVSACHVMGRAAATCTVSAGSPKADAAAIIEATRQYLKPARAATTATMATMAMTRARRFMADDGFA